MKIILMAILATMLLVGMVSAAGTPIDLSTLGKKAEIKSTMTPVIIKYTREAPRATTDAVDVRTLGRSFGTFTGASGMQPVELGASRPVTVTPSFSISVSNRTSSQVTRYTMPFAIGQPAIYTPQQMIFGGA
ncbi:hypothetical protein P0O24_00185 [Methanotrichaceae archaeon M04Ac]|uniref:Uncharacterized protein n=1 Tax=Candidatus Methanocrinis alkalitolerans TaxID=3033395 RepID=A0ABT5XBB3_9EURY|nr:hypothetical protein [Candidatus Methanocrinis alkalitolerans]MCR3883839.1 hypothetical protein [Methanothrix sp.]MDF0592005.1 hypothetical protein [Candidatus Methanocrinis alkalitolerans]